MTKNKNILKKLFLALFAIIILTAFGCKNTDDQVATDQTLTDQASTDISFAPPEPSIEADTTSDIQVPTTDSTGETTTTDVQDSLTSPEVDTGSDTSTTDNKTTSDTISSEDTTITNEDLTSNTQDGATSDEDQVIKLSKVLAEIYGTFTNKDLEPYKNLKNLKSYSSDAMNDWIDGKVANYQASDSTSFYGITTKALSAGVLDSSSTDYQILVTCEREEISESSSSPKKYYQLIEMNFTKKGQDWILDGIYWQ